ncbi:MAG: M20/M25/M40 family metallo-hydrolase [Phycisphaerales bacterium]
MRHAAVVVGPAIALIAGCGVNPQAMGPVQHRGNFAVIDGEVADVPDVRLGNPAIVRKIVREGRRDNRVMEHLSTLCEEYGPRLTGSTNCEASARWAADQFRAWGLENVSLHHWGDIPVRFDRGPSHGAVFTANSDGDLRKARDLQFTTLSWTRGTDGPARGPVVRMPESVEEARSMADDIAGAWVLIPEAHSSDRRGIRSVGYLMRERTSLRHEIRNESRDDHAEAHAAGDAAEVAHGGEQTSGDRPEGAHWAGTYMYSGNPINTWLQLEGLTPKTLTDAGPVSGTLSIPGFHTGPISDAAIEGDVLTFDWKHEMGTSHITLNIDGDTATGQSTSSSGNVYEIELAYHDGAATDDAEPEDAESAEAALERAILRVVLAAEPLGFISSSRDEERVWTTRKNGWDEMPLHEYEQDVEVNVIAPDYDYINSRVIDGVPFEVEFNLDHELTAGPIACHNVIAEIPGTELPDEVVIMSAHLDSWDGPGSQGVVDNGTGCAVMMEAARLLMASGVRPKRTIRFALWTGEEQGLHGSREYVEDLSEAELEKISAAFVDDGGTNFQGGIPAADYMVPFLAAASAPINGIFFDQTDYDAAMSDDDASNDAYAGYMNVNIRPTGDSISTHSGSDHASFNRAGVPGFFWDEIGRANYRYGWHTQHDTMALAIPGYLQQSSTNSAVVAYQLADAPSRLPRSQAELDRVMGKTKPAAEETMTDNMTIEPID